jgi:serine/threonine-protein kinase
MKMSLSEFIDEMPFFESFSEQEKKTFAKMKRSVLAFYRDDAIISEGDESSTMYLLLKGTAVISRTQDDAKIRLSKLKPGELFGEMSFISKKIRKSDVIASEDVLVMKMDDAFFKKIDPDIRDKIKNHLILLLIKRLENMNDSLMKISKLLRP